MSGVFVRRDPPHAYPAANYCTGCGADFASVAAFDRHRAGRHEYTYSQGLALDPPREDGRRCLDADEMLALGLQPLRDEEIRAGKHRCRTGFGVALWHDPAETERARRAFRGPLRASAKRQQAPRAEGRTELPEEIAEEEA